MGSKNRVQAEVSEQKNQYLNAIGFENTYWYSTDTCHYALNNELIEAPQLTGHYTLLIYLTGGSPPKGLELELEQLQLISPHFRSGKTSSVNSENVKFSPALEWCFYAIWLPPLLKNNFWYNIDENDPWQDLNDNDVEPQHQLIADIKLLKLNSKVLTFTSQPQFPNAYAIDVEVCAIHTLSELVNTAENNRVTPTHFGNVATSTAAFNNSHITHWCEQGHLLWNMTVGKKNKNSLLMESTMGNELITLNGAIART